MARRLGALLPGSPRASQVLNRYLDDVIDQSMLQPEELSPSEKIRREQSLLGSLLSQNISRKVRSSLARAART